jgi:hypothetical protein
MTDTTDMSDLLTKLDDLKTERGPVGSTSAQWINPRGQILDTSDDIHISFVIKNPEKFGTSLEAIYHTYAKHQEEIGREGKAREEIMAGILKRGWIRTRLNRAGRNIFWTVSIEKMTDKIKDNLYNWSNHMIKQGGYAGSKYNDVKFDIVSGLPIRNSYRLGDLADDKLMQESRKKPELNIMIVESVDDFS